MRFLHSFQSEWLKTRHTLSSWLVIIGAFFIPVFSLLIGLKENSTLLAIEAHTPTYWQMSWLSSTALNALLLFPIGAILGTSQVVQIEFKNNTWKQVNTLPFSYANIYFSKLAVILTMMLEFFILFDIGFVLSHLIPCVIKGTFPNEAFPFGFILKQTGEYFLVSLTVVSFQYLLSLQLKNIILPLGIGILLLISGPIVSFSGKAYLDPFTYYSSISTDASKEMTPGQVSFLTKKRDSLANDGHAAAELKNKQALRPTANRSRFSSNTVVPQPPVHFVWMSLGYTLLFIAVGFLLFRFKKSKG